MTQRQVHHLLSIERSLRHMRRTWKPEPDIYTYDMSGSCIQYDEYFNPIDCDPEDTEVRAHLNFGWLGGRFNSPALMPVHDSNGRVYIYSQPYSGQASMHGWLLGSYVEGVNVELIPAAAQPANAE